MIVGSGIFSSIFFLTIIGSVFCFKGKGGGGGGAYCRNYILDWIIYLDIMGYRLH